MKNAFVSLLLYFFLGGLSMGISPRRWECIYSVSPGVPECHAIPSLWVLVR